MIGIVMASHGDLASAMLRSAEMIMGSQDQVEALALEPDDDPMALKDIISTAVDKVNEGDGVIVLVDLIGGSPCNASGYVASDGVPVICGMNLPILLELLGMRYSSVEEILDSIIRAGKDGIMDIREIFRG